MQVVVGAVAKAIRSSRKFNQAEHKAAADEICAAIVKDSSLLPELSEMTGKINNVSQCSQDLAKTGIVSHGDPTAFARQVAEAVHKMDAAVKNAEKKL